MLWKSWIKNIVNYHNKVQLPCKIYILEMKLEKWVSTQKLKTPYVRYSKKCWLPNIGNLIFRKYEKIGSNSGMTLMVCNQDEFTQQTHD